MTLEEILHQSVVLERRGDIKQSFELCLQALRIAPDNEIVLYRTSSFFLHLKNPNKALGLAKKGYSINRNLKFIEILLACYKLNEDYSSAVQLLNEILAKNHSNSALFFNLGLFLELNDENSKAIEAYKKAILLNGNLDAKENLLMLMVAENKKEKIIELIDDILVTKRGKNNSKGFKDALTFFKEIKTPNKEVHTTKFKLRHDKEQLEYLIDKNILNNDYRELVSAYNNVLTIDKEENEFFNRYEIKNNNADWDIVNAFYNKLIWHSDLNLNNVMLLNYENDFQKIEESYKNSGCLSVSIDSLLTQQALEELREFCRTATIWYDIKDNYIGAYFSEGFGSSFILKLARELQLAMPNIFMGHKLTQAWAYKYGPKKEGIKIHADAAAINLNFWIAEEASNLDIESGGLVVYNKKPPADWQFQDYNNNQDKINEFLKQYNVEKSVFPHRENRGVIFDSDLFHATDKISFKDSFLDRRINITMLFGKRDLE